LHFQPGKIYKLPLDTDQDFHIYVGDSSNGPVFENSSRQLYVRNHNLEEYRELARHEAIIQWIQHGVTGAIMCVTLDDEYDELSTDYGDYKVLKQEKTYYEA
jgi:hypothetical protein